MPKWKVPFKADGTPMRYALNDPNSRYRRDDMQHHPDFADEWRENYEFTATLYFNGFARGRSAAYAYFNTADDQRYTMFLTDLADAIPYLEKGFLRDKTFTFTKRGQNYGIKVVA